MNRCEDGLFTETLLERACSSRCPTLWPGRPPQFAAAEPLPSSPTRQTGRSTGRSRRSRTRPRPPMTPMGEIVRLRRKRNCVFLSVQLQVYISCFVKLMSGPFYTIENVRTLQVKLPKAASLLSSCSWAASELGKKRLTLSTLEADLCSGRRGGGGGGGGATTW